MALLPSGACSHGEAFQAAASSEQFKARLDVIEHEIKALDNTMEGLDKQLMLQHAERSTDSAFWSIFCFPGTPAYKKYLLTLEYVGCLKKRAALREEQVRLQQQVAVATCPSRPRPADEPPPLGPAQPSTEASHPFQTGHAATQVAHHGARLCSQDTMDTKLHQCSLVQDMLLERDERHPQLRHRLAGSVVREGDGATPAGL